MIRDVGRSWAPWLARPRAGAEDAYKKESILVGEIPIHAGQPSDTLARQVVLRTVTIVT